MNAPNYEVGRLAALTVRMVMASGLSRDDARAALDLACTMMDGDAAHERATARMPMHGGDHAAHTPAHVPRR